MNDGRAKVRQESSSAKMPSISPSRDKNMVVDHMVNPGSRTRVESFEDEP